MEIWSQSSWWVEVVYNALLLFLPPLAGLAVATPLGLGVVRFVKQIYREFRPLVDESTDAIPRLIAAKTPYTAEQASKFLIDNIDKIIAALPDASNN